MKKLRVGIAGYGYSATIFHIPFLRCNKRYEIRKIYSRRATQIDSQIYPWEFVDSYNKLLVDGIDIIVICTPNGEHFEMAKRAIENGKHVIVEKPITVHSYEAEILRDLSLEKDVKIVAFQNRRLDGPFLTAQKLINSDYIGRVLEFDNRFDRYVVGKNKKEWKNIKQSGVNILYDLGIHLVDQTYALFGMPLEIYADFEKQRQESADFDKFEIILYYDEFTARLGAGEQIMNSEPCIKVRGTKGTYIKDGMDVQEEELRNGRDVSDEQWGYDVPNRFGRLYIPLGEIIIEKTIETVPGNYQVFYDNFSSAVTGGQELLVSIDESIDVLKIIEASIQSNREKRRIRLR